MKARQSARVLVCVVAALVATRAVAQAPDARRGLRGARAVTGLERLVGVRHAVDRRVQDSAPADQTGIERHSRAGRSGAWGVSSTDLHGAHRRFCGCRGVSIHAGARDGDDRGGTRASNLHGWPAASGRRCPDEHRHLAGPLARPNTRRRDYTHRSAYTSSAAPESQSACDRRKRPHHGAHHPQGREHSRDRGRDRRPRCAHGARPTHPHLQRLPKTMPTEITTCTEYDRSIDPLG